MEQDDDSMCGSPLKMQKFDCSVDFRISAPIVTSSLLGVPVKLARFGRNIAGILQTLEDSGPQQ